MLTSPAAAARARPQAADAYAADKYADSYSKDAADCVCAPASGRKVYGERLAALLPPAPRAPASPTTPGGDVLWWSTCLDPRGSTTADGAWPALSACPPAEKDPCTEPKVEDAKTEISTCKATCADGKDMKFGKVRAGLQVQQCLSQLSFCPVDQAWNSRCALPAPEHFRHDCMGQPVLCPHSRGPFSRTLTPSLHPPPCVLTLPLRPPPGLQCAKVCPGDCIEGKDGKCHKACPKGYKSCESFGKKVSHWHVPLQQPCLHTSCSLLLTRLPSLQPLLTSPLLPAPSPCSTAPPPPPCSAATAAPCWTRCTSTWTRSSPASESPRSTNSVTTLWGFPAAWAR